ncbi:MAG: MATE family efflux transporter [Candidatus Brocadiae bacterium]|nr:MATE family efflux transporter [Candidatus Brocadiia bacterium]
MKYLSSLKNRYFEPCGYKDIIQLSIPLVLSTGCWSIQQFVDGVFLSWYSADALAASMPAGILSFCIVSFFLGTVSYINTFVAQYHGSGQNNRISSAIWQAIYFALFSEIALLCILPFARHIISWSGHPPALAIMEDQYFCIVCSGSGFMILASAMSSFYSGRGKTWTIMWVNISGTIVNILLDYALIFGNWGFPELGIQGAALATVASYANNAFWFTLLLFCPSKNRKEYCILSQWRLDKDLFWRLARYGAPNGVHFVLDMVSFTFFIFLIGKIGRLELTATTMAFQINNVIFFPMMGFSMGNAILVGQQLGKNRPDIAVRCTWSNFHLTFCYMTIVASLYCFYPTLFINPFAAKAEPGTFDKIREIGIILLRFIAFYSIFDTFNLIFSSALKGAGDTRFIMFYSSFLGFLFLVLPPYLIISTGKGNIYIAWIFLSLFCTFSGLGFFWRFQTGKWKSMRVIGKKA